ncbi:MAG: hypothetical protein C4518_19040 [Desulfobacteraceae bacterium]|nr:MAG: hypothetical protein C4518_19040 [Desulfobacteraceae bacterium]
MSIILKKFHHLLRPGRDFQKNQNGQAVIELALMMTFLAMILLALMIIHELQYKNILTIEALRNEMRISMDRNAPGPFTKNIKQKDVFVEVPGRMKEVFGAPFLSQPHRIEYYEGSYQGAGDSYYKQRELYRKILIQN